MEKITVEEIAHIVHGVVEGDGKRLISGLNSLQRASQDELSFFSGAEFKVDFEKTQAGVVLVEPEVSSPTATVIRVSDPGAAFDALVLKWLPGPEIPEPQIHPTAIVEEGAQIHEEAFIGPYCVIGKNTRVGKCVLYSHVSLAENVTVGDGTILWPFICIREGCQIGQNCLIHQGVMIGFDGFGFDNVKGQWKKIPQRGIVVIEDDVEVGANATVARARFGQTFIGQGTKIDADTQVGHGTHIGRHVYVGAMCGLGGSCEIGDYSVLAPKSGIVPQAKIPKQTMLAVRTIVTKTLKKSGSYMGFPAIPIDEERRRLVSTRRLHHLEKEVKELRERLEKLE